jgi:energy-coupling factor transport system ATP-binding protein
MPSPSARSGWSVALSESRAGQVSVDGLTWRPVGRRQPVLRDVSLTLGAGERVLLAGPSGSGKSTLLRALAGLLTTVDAGDLTGSVLLDGHPPGSRAGEVGLVLQEPGAGIVASTVERDVAFGLENTLVPRSEMAGRIADALARVGLEVPPDTPTNALSGGQTQRLALAGTLALRPSLLLLDEPTAMLDPANAARVRSVVGSVLDASTLTCVVVEHRLGPWLHLVDRLVVLSDDGRVVLDGPARATVESHRDEQLGRGLWVAGAPPPEPVVIDLAGPAGSAGPASPRLVVEVPLRVDRTVRTLDGATRELTALDLREDLDGVDVAVVGPSGSGKSTLLHALAGFERPTAGAVATGDGTPAADLSAHALPRTVAWVPQWSSSAIVADTVVGELLVTSRELGDDSEATRDRALAVLRALGLGRLAQADPRQVSGGEQRRIALAAAVLHRPAVLLSDEPTVGQDRHTWAAVAGLLDAHRAAGGRTVTATHDEALIERTPRVVHLVAPPGPPPPATPRRPLLGRRNPLALLVAAFLAVPAGILSTTWRTGLFVLAVEVVLGLAGLWAPRVDGSDAPRPRRRWRRLGLRLLPGLVAAVSVAWSTWWLAGHDVEAAATVALRVLVIVVPSALLIPWIDPDALGDHLAQRLRLPARPVVAVAAALARVHTFGDVWAEIGRARRVRGLGVSLRSPASVVAHLGALTMGLLVRTLRAAADLAVAMDSRGFAGAHRRTWFAPAPWGWGDTVLLASATVPLVVAVVR